MTPVKYNVKGKRKTTVVKKTYVKEAELHLFGTWAPDALEMQRGQLHPTGGSLLRVTMPVPIK
jgi:hypothetical protein